MFGHPRIEVFINPNTVHAGIALVNLQPLCFDFVQTNLQVTVQCLLITSELPGLLGNEGGVVVPSERGLELNLRLVPTRVPAAH